MADEDLSSKELPLLKKVYLENCPGCKIDQFKETQRGVPYKILILVWITVLCNGLAVSLLFPFLYFMIRDFQIAETEEDTSYYAGYLGSAYMIGRAIASLSWGIVADKYGRKPVITICTASMVVFNTLFGLSLNFWMAMWTRFLLGCFAGLLGVMKAYVSEICRPEHQALGMSALSGAWATGLIVGPAAGGLLAQPAEKYPNFFSKESLFGRFPYFLPCLVTSAFALVVTVVSLQLPESLHNHSEKTLQDDSYETLEEAACKKRSTQKCNCTVPTTKKSLIKNWPLMSSIIVYCIIALHDIAYTEVFSLWAVSPRSLGGLSYTTNDVGEVLAISGGGMLIFQLFAFPIAESMLGPIAVARICTALSVPLLQCYPLIATLSGFSLEMLLNCASIFKNGFMSMICTSLFLMQNNAVDQEQRGAACGLCITTMSLFKAIGPAWGGAMLSWAEKRHDATFLPGTQMVFFLLNIVLVLALISMFKPFLALPSESHHHQ